MKLDGAPLCAVCVTAFAVDMPPVTGYRSTTDGRRGERLYNVQLGQVIAGTAVQCHNVNAVPLPLRGVTMVQGTVVCEQHARVLLDPVLTPPTPSQRRGWPF